MSVKFLKLKRYHLHYTPKTVNLYWHSCIYCVFAVCRSVCKYPGGDYVTEYGLDTQEASSLL